MKKSDLIKKLNEVYAGIENLESKPVNDMPHEAVKVNTKLETIINEIEDDDFKLDSEEESTEE